MEYARHLVKLTLAYLTILLVVTVVTGLGKVSWWFVVALLFLAGLAAFVMVQARLEARPQVFRLLAHIDREHFAWARQERCWVGRSVVLREDLTSNRSRAGLHSLVPAGTVGEIVALRRDTSAPFTVQFPGFPHKVVVGLDQLEVRQ